MKLRSKKHKNGLHSRRFITMMTFLSVSPLNVLISAIKQSEDNNDVLFRCVETTGKNTHEVFDLSIIGLKWDGEFRPSEIKTLHVNT